MEGQLEKKTTGGKWHTRHFRLAEGKLTWLKSDNKTEASIDLRKDGEVRDIKFGVRKFAFEVSGEGKTVTVAASGDAEKQQWITALELATRSRRSVAPQNHSRKSRNPKAQDASKRVSASGKTAQPKKLDTQKVAGIASVLGLGGPGGGGGMKSDDANEKLQKKLAAGKVAVPMFGAPTKCTVCQKAVYKMEEMTVDKMVLHKRCFRCQHCNRQLTISNFAAVNKTLYCKTHYLELFASSGGSYEVFGDAGFKKKTGRSSKAHTGESKEGQDSQVEGSEVEDARNNNGKTEKDSTTISSKEAREDESKDGQGKSPEKPDGDDKREQNGEKEKLKEEAEEDAEEAEAEKEKVERAAPIATLALEAMKFRNAKNPNARANEVIVSSPDTDENADKKDDDDDDDETMNHAVLSRPKVGGRRRAPKRQEIGKLLPPVEIKDRASHEFSFRVETGTGITLIAHALSLIEKDAWVTCLANTIYAMGIQKELDTAQRVDMMSALQAQMKLEAFKQAFKTNYSGYLEKLSIKSQRNWKKRYFELKDGKLSYFTNETAKKPLEVLELGHFSCVKDNEGRKVEADVEEFEAQINGEEAKDDENQDEDEGEGEGEGEGEQDRKDQEGGEAEAKNVDNNDDKENEDESKVNSNEGGDLKTEITIPNDDDENKSESEGPKDNTDTDAGATSKTNEEKGNEDQVDEKEIPSELPTTDDTKTENEGGKSKNMETKNQSAVKGDQDNAEDATSKDAIEVKDDAQIEQEARKCGVDSSNPDQFKNLKMSESSRAKKGKCVIM